MLVTPAGQNLNAVLGECAADHVPMKLLEFEFQPRGMLTIHFLQALCGILSIGVTLPSVVM